MRLAILFSCVLALSANAFGQTELQQVGHASACPSSSPDDGLFIRALMLSGPSCPGPLTEKERFYQFLSSTMGPSPIFGSIVGGALAQATDSPREWEQGAIGLGRRMGASFAYTGARNTITYAASILFHEDNRYFASGRTGAAPRIGMALASTLLAHNRQGKLRLSVSRLLGVGGAAAISREWYPRSFQGGANIAEAAGFSLAGQASLNVVREFVPDLVRHFRNRASNRQP